MSEINTVQMDGFTVTGNTQSAEKMAESLKKPAETPAAPVSDPGDDSDDSGAPEPVAAAPTGSEPVKRSEAKKDMKARMLEATQKQAAEKKRADEIEARANRAEAELAEYRRKLTTEAPKPAEPKAKPAFVEDPSDPAPKEDDFENYSQFVAATARWGARQEHREISKTAENESRRVAFREFQIDKVKKFNERVSERAKTDPDLTLPDSVVNLLPKKPFEMDHQLTADDHIGAYFTSEERGLDLMVYFKDHEDELGRIRTLPPYRVPIELARIEGRLDGAITATPEKPVTVRANPPVRPVTAVPPSAEDPMALPDAKLSDREWGRRREALEIRRRAAQH
jgi:hypothetical protein